MTWDVKRSGRQARVFISYARDDGEEFANYLRNRLEAENIPIWQDRTEMEGGRDWWEQIVEALNQVEFMVLVMTPAALKSETVRKEWLYARQQGVCIYPVLGPYELDSSHLSRWIRKLHFYDLKYEWPKFINDLNTRCQRVRVPFMAKDLRPADFVQRPEEYEKLLSALLDESFEGPMASSVVLRGLGGNGKTTMALAICQDTHIREAFDDGILWVTLGENSSNLIDKVKDLIEFLSKERPNFVNIEAATAYFKNFLPIVIFYW